MSPRWLLACAPLAVAAASVPAIAHAAPDDAAPVDAVAPPSGAALTPALAAGPATAPADSDDEDKGAIVVTARRLDKARDSIDPSVAANDFRITRQNLDLQPGGADRSLKGVLLQAPGVTQDADGDGDIHIRNEHGNIQYRLNGVTVPETFDGFGALVDPRVADSVEVITGALPAQYGYHTAGIVALKTRTDSFDFDGDIGLYGGSYNTFQPSATIRDSLGSLNYFASASYLRNDQGVANPTPSRTAIHDRTDQYRGFGYASYILGESSRLTAFGGLSIGTFQIPNTPGLTPSYAVNGRTKFDSAAIDLNRRQQTYFGVLSYQYAGESLDFQIAPFLRSAHAHYIPDASGAQLAFNGADTDLRLSSLAWGVQADGSLHAGDAHTVRFGAFYRGERARSDSVNRVFAVDSAGNQLTSTPISVLDSQRQSSRTIGVYVQDEWKLADTLTFNYGVRFDDVSAVVKEHQLSPRASLVWKPAPETTFHVGYARYFTPPPLELVTSGTRAAFNGTTGEAAVDLADPVRSEREHNFDVGAQQKVGKAFTFGVDAYYKLKTNLLDENTLGSTLIQAPFNYAKSRGWGVEVTANYETAPFEAYVNVARGEQKATRIVSNQFLFDPAELAYIANHYIYTDHSQKWTLSGGAAAKIEDGIGQLRPSIDFIYGDGLRKDDPAGIVPNGGKVPSYVQVNFGIAQRLGSSDEHNLTIRFDVVNVFDSTYLLRDGSGVGAGQPEYGPRRGFFVGIRKGF